MSTVADVEEDAEEVLPGSASPSANSEVARADKCVHPLEVVS